MCGQLKGTGQWVAEFDVGNGFNICTRDIGIFANTLLWSQPHWSHFSNGRDSVNTHDMIPELLKEGTLYWLGHVICNHLPCWAPFHT
jgi:hypothetical protein